MDIETTIKSYIGDRTIEGQSPMLAELEKWYKGYDPSFHDYKVFTGTSKSISKRKKSLNVGKIICEQWANLLCNEKTTVSMNDKDKVLLDAIFEENNFWVKANELVEKSFALGIGAFVLSVNSLSAYKNENGEDEINISKADGVLKIDTVDAKKIIPITRENGEITECAFAISNTQDSHITIHLKEEGQYIIKTIYFKDSNFNSFDRVSEFKTLGDVQWFRIIHPNIVNNRDLDKNYNLSILANQIDKLKSIDNKYDLFDTEFRYGKKRTYISTKLNSYNAKGELVETLSGADEDVFFIPEDDNGNNLIKTDTSDLRTGAIVQALSSEISMLGYAVGFGKNYLTFSSEGMGRPIQTATGVMMQNADLFRSVHKHEIIIESALVGFIKAIINASNTFTQNKFSPKAEDDLSINFDDSIFEDKESEKENARKDVASGIMSEVEFRMKFYSEDEETAKEKLYKNPEYIGMLAARFLPLLTSKAITPKLFVFYVYGKEDAELEKAIETAQQSSGVDMEAMLSQFGA